MIYLSLTTLPSRIKYFYHFYNHIMNCSIKPDYIILNIYNSSLRNDVMNIPDDITCLPNLILKLIGFFYVLFSLLYYIVFL